MSNYRESARMSDWSDEREIPEKMHFNGEAYWSIAKNDTKRLLVGMYRGKPVINIRTFFRDRGDAPGVMRPSQKGIALQMDQWDLIKDMIPVIDAEIEAIRDTSNRQRNLEDENAELRRKLAALEAGDESKEG
jgi:hypothetical protein